MSSEHSIYVSLCNDLRSVGVDWGWDVRIISDYCDRSAFAICAYLWEKRKWLCRSELLSSKSVFVITRAFDITTEEIKQELGLEVEVIRSQPMTSVVDSVCSCVPQAIYLILLQCGWTSFKPNDDDFDGFVVSRLGPTIGVTSECYIDACIVRNFESLENETCVVEVEARCYRSLPLVSDTLTTEGNVAFCACTGETIAVREISDQKDTLTPFDKANQARGYCEYLPSTEKSFIEYWRRCYGLETKGSAPAKARCKKVLVDTSCGPAVYPLNALSGQPYEVPAASRRRAIGIVSAVVDTLMCYAHENLPQQSYRVFTKIECHRNEKNNVVVVKSDLATFPTSRQQNGLNMF